MKTKQKLFGLLLALCLAFTVVPMPVSAAGGNPSLTVDGVDALNIPSGNGWSFDKSKNTLTLNGYNGGSIIASYINLKVILAEGSKNTISTTDEYGLANIQDPFASPYHSLSIEGGTDSSLAITAANHAIFVYGGLNIENCNLTAENTTTSTVTGEMECISSHSTIGIKNSTINVITKGVGITSYDEHSIEGSKITVDAGNIGIHANNKSLSITKSTLDVSGGTAALFSYFGIVSLTECTGELKAKTAAIYAQNIDGYTNTELTDCELILTADYGIMAYSGVLITGGELTLNSQIGVYAYSATYKADTVIKGTAVVDGTNCAGQALLVYGSYSSENTAKVTGVIRQYQGDPSTEKFILSGDMSISKDTAYNKNTVIPEGSHITVNSGVTFDLSGAPSVVIGGKLTNNGTVKLNGKDTDNQGTIYNYNELLLADNQSIKNSGKIYSVCTSSFDVSAYGASGGALHVNLIKTDAQPATHLKEGNITYWHCNDCGKYFSDETGTTEISYEDTIIGKTTGHNADGTGWKFDDKYHWNTCECGEILNKEEHKFEWITDKQPTQTEKGSRHKECSVCHYKKAAEDISAIGTNERADNPQTGDNTSLMFWLMLLLTSGGSLFITGFYFKKKKYGR